LCELRDEASPNQPPILLLAVKWFIAQLNTYITMTINEFKAKFGVDSITFNQRKEEGSFMASVTIPSNGVVIQLFTTKKTGDNFDGNSPIENINGKFFVGEIKAPAPQAYKFPYNNVLFDEVNKVLIFAGDVELKAFRVTMSEEEIRYICEAINEKRQRDGKH